MKLNTLDSVALGKLVAKVGVLEAIVAKKTPTVILKPTELATPVAVANAGGKKIKIAVQLQDGAEAIIPYNGDLAVSVVSSGNGTVKAPTKVLLKNGYGEVEYEYTGTWAGLDTCITTVGESDTILGASVTQATCTDTIAE